MELPIINKYNINEYTNSKVNSTVSFNETIEYFNNFNNIYLNDDKITHILKNLIAIFKSFNNIVQKRNEYLNNNDEQLIKITHKYHVNKNNVVVYQEYTNDYEADLPTKNDFINLLDTYIERIINVQTNNDENKYLILKNMNFVGKIYHCGDIHGSFGSVENLLRFFIKDEINNPNNNNIIVFTGDYIDRGYNDIEVLFLVLTLKILMPNKIHLISGNHEEKNIYYIYGFIRTLRNIEWHNDQSLIDKIDHIFNDMNLYIQIDKYAYCHGIPPLDFNINNIDFKEQLHWSDIHNNTNDTFNFDRGYGSKIGTNTIKNIFINNNIVSLFRGHEPTVNGTNIFEVYDNNDENNENDKLIGYVFTVHTLANYSGRNNFKGSFIILEKYNDDIEKDVINIITYNDEEMMQGKGAKLDW